MDLCEFEASLVYVVFSMTARETHINPLSKKKKKKKKKKPINKQTFMERDFVKINQTTTLSCQHINFLINADKLTFENNSLSQ